MESFVCGHRNAPDTGCGGDVASGSGSIPGAMEIVDRSRQRQRQFLLRHHAGLCRVTSMYYQTENKLEQKKILKNWLKSNKSNDEDTKDISIEIPCKNILKLLFFQIKIEIQDKSSFRRTIKVLIEIPSFFSMKNGSFHCFFQIFECICFAPLAFSE